MENIGILYIHLEYFTAIWYILRPFGIFFNVLVYFTKKKSGNPGYKPQETCSGSKLRQNSSEIIQSCSETKTFDS
jgi:hypothetical protein